MSTHFEPADKPWVICRLGVKSTKRIIRRYVNRQDAEDDLRMMTRFVKDGGQYVVAFDVVEVIEPLQEELDKPCRNDEVEE